MYKNKKFFDNLDTGWDDVIANVYNSITHPVTLFAGISNGVVDTFNINRDKWNDLFNIQLKLLRGYEYTGTYLEIDNSFFKNVLKSNKHSDISYDKIEKVIIDIELMGIDVNLLYSYDMISELEYNNKISHDDYTNIEITINYNYKIDDKLIENSFNIGTQNDASFYNINNEDELPLLYLNEEFLKYIVERSVNLYNNNNYIKVSDETRDKLYNMVKEINIKNKEYTNPFI